jgi:hypothetical protein
MGVRESVSHLYVRCYPLAFINKKLYTLATKMPS